MYSCSLALMEGHDQFARMAWVKSSELFNFSLLLVWLSLISHLCEHAPAFLSLILVCVYIYLYDCMFLCLYHDKYMYTILYTYDCSKVLTILPSMCVFNYHY